MMSLDEIKLKYPGLPAKFDEDILREYLQYQILGIVARSKYATKLSFLGGTALRIIFNSGRFSEDLDFDNFGLTRDEFADLADHVGKELTRIGFDTEVSIAGVDAYRCNIKFPDLLFDYKLSGHKNEKILLQIDSLAHGFAYKPLLRPINQFGVNEFLPVTPPDILLSQKFTASVGRPRIKGRDFYDMSFLFSFTKPNFEYLKFKIGITDWESYRKEYLEKIKTFNFKKLGQDVIGFLLKKDDVRRVETFREYIEKVSLD